MNIKTEATIAALRMAFDYVAKDPENNLPKVGSFLEKILPANNDTYQHL